MRKERNGGPYHSADIIIAMILGAGLGLTVSVMTGELLKPILFYGDMVLASMLICGAIGFIGRQRSTHWLEELLKQIRELWYWYHR